MSSKYLLVLFLIGVVVLTTTASLVDHNHKPLKGKVEKLPPKPKPPHGHLLVEEANYNEDSYKGHEKPPPKHKPPHHPGRMLLEEVSNKVDDFHGPPDSKGKIPPYGYKPPYGYEPPYGYKPPYGRQPPYGYRPPPHGHLPPHGHGLLEEEDIHKPRKGKNKKPPPNHKPPHGNQYLEEEVEGEGYPYRPPRKTEPTYGHRHGHGHRPPPLN